MSTCKCTTSASMHNALSMLAFGSAWLPRFPDWIGDLRLHVVPCFLHWTQHGQLPCRLTSMKYGTVRLLSSQISFALTCATALMQFYVVLTLGTKSFKRSQRLGERGGCEPFMRTISGSRNWLKRSSPMNLSCWLRRSRWACASSACRILLIVQLLGQSHDTLPKTEGSFLMSLCIWATTMCIMCGWPPPMNE